MRESFNNQKVRAVVADDHPLFRDGLIRALAGNDTRKAPPVFVLTPTHWSPDEAGLRSHPNVRLLRRPVHGEQLREYLYGELSGAHRIGMLATAGIPDRRDVVDVHTQSQMTRHSSVPWPAGGTIGHGLSAEKSPSP